MARLRYNGLATTLGADLASGDTTITFTAALAHSGGTAVPTISGSDYIPLTILDAGGAVTEIVYLTAYTSGATTGTIARGKEGTTAVAHASGDMVMNAGTVADSNRAVGVQAYVTSTSIPDSSETKIGLTSEAFDTDGFHDNATNNTRLTVPAGCAGYYDITGMTYFTYSATGSRTAALFINNAKVGEAVGGVGASTATFVYPAYLNEGDYVELATYQTSGGALALHPTIPTRLTILRIGT